MLDGSHLYKLTSDNKIRPIPFVYKKGKFVKLNKN